MTTGDVVYVALFASLMAAFALFPPIIIPVLNVPITLQSIGPMLAGGVLGARKGAFSITLFLTLTAIGLPLLPGGKCGFAPFFGPSGGFLIGWIAAAAVIGLITQHRPSGYVGTLSTCLFGGILCLYLIGVPWAAHVARLTLKQAFLTSTIFLIGDTIKACIAAKVIVTVRQFRLGTHAT